MAAVHATKSERPATTTNNPEDPKYDPNDGSPNRPLSLMTKLEFRRGVGVTQPGTIGDDVCVDLAIRCYQQLRCG